MLVLDGLLCNCVIKNAGFSHSEVCQHIRMLLVVSRDTDQPVIRVHRRVVEVDDHGLHGQLRIHQRHRLITRLWRHRSVVISLAVAHHHPAHQGMIFIMDSSWKLILVVDS